MSENTVRKFPQGGVHEILQPAGWPRPKGYANGVKAHGHMIFAAGMVGWDENEKFPDGFIAQVRQALKNIVAVLAEGGGRPEHIVRMTWFVVNKQDYLSALAEIGEVYREVMGRNFPAMTLVEVKGLVEHGALLEIEATAVLP